MLFRVCLERMFTPRVVKVVFHFLAPCRPSSICIYWTQSRSEERTMTFNTIIWYMLLESKLSE